MDSEHLSAICRGGFYGTSVPMFFYIIDLWRKSSLAIYREEREMARLVSTHRQTLDADSCQGFVTPFTRSGRGP
jgi:hypothetical protein